MMKNFGSRLSALIVAGTWVLVFAMGCVTDVWDQGSEYDLRTVTIQTLSLFNQRRASRLSEDSWRGDWIFRRERLDQIDRELRSIKPDLVILQEAMSKKESPSESDRNILLAGALSEYDWHMRVVKEYDDTQEVESMAVAAGLPLRIERSKTLSKRELWDVGDKGYLTVSSINVEGQSVLVFNVQIPESEANRDLWYLFVKDRIADRLREFSHCPKRLIVAGFLPGTEDSRRYRDFLNKLGLKDVSTGFCELESNCYTATPLNELYMATVGDERPSRADRILVHKSAVVRSSRSNFKESSKTHYSKKFGIDNIWPTQRFGWVATIRFARCE